MLCVPAQHFQPKHDISCVVYIRTIYVYTSLICFIYLPYLPGTRYHVPGIHFIYTFHLQQLKYSGVK